jgi:putative effector of murein hydrolase LrgA (UPF0299 family)
MACCGSPLAPPAVGMVMFGVALPFDLVALKAFQHLADILLFIMN